MPKTLVGEQPFCAVFQNICGSEKVSKKRGKEYQKFQSKVFCLTAPKNLVAEQPFCAVFQKNSGSERILKKRGKGIKSFSLKIFVSQCRKFCSGNNLSVLCFREILAAKKF